MTAVGDLHRYLRICNRGCVGNLGSGFVAHCMLQMSLCAPSSYQKPAICCHLLDSSLRRLHPLCYCHVQSLTPPPLSLSVSLHETGFSLSRMSRIIRGIGIFLCSIKPKRSSSSSCASCWVLQRMCCGTVHSQQGVQNGSLRCGRCNPGSCTKRNRLNPYCLLQACQCASHTATLP